MLTLSSTFHRSVHLATLTKKSAQARIDRLKITNNAIEVSGWVRLNPAPPFRVTTVQDSGFLNPLNQQITTTAVKLNYKLDLGGMFSALFGISAAVT